MLAGRRLTPGGSAAIPPRVVYVELAGSDNNEGDSAGTAVATIECAIQIAGMAWETPLTIQLGLGKWTLAAETHLRSMGGSVGVGYPLAIRGTMVDSGLGVLTSSAATQGSSFNGGTVSIAAGGLVANAWTGYQLRYTSGSAALQAAPRWIAANTAATPGVFTVVGVFGDVPVGNETFVVEKPGTFIDCTGVLNSVTFPHGLIIQDIDLNAGSCYTYGSITLASVRLTGMTLYAQEGSLSCGIAYPSAYSRFSTFAPNGAYITTGAMFSYTPDAAVNVYSSFVDGTGIRLGCAVGGQLTLASSRVGVARLSCASGGRLTVIDTFMTFCAAPAAIDVLSGTLDAYAVYFASSGGAAIRGTYGATLRLSTCIGAANTTYGVELRSGSKLINLGSNTVPGTANDTLIGANAAGATWVQLATRAVALTCDYAAGSAGAATPEFCDVQA